MRPLLLDLIRCAEITLKQTAKAIEQVARQAMADDKAKVWIHEVEHYRGLLLRIIDQTRRRVLHGESVPASEKLVSRFEPHTDIIISRKCQARCVNQGLHSQFATDERGHRPLEFIRPGYSQKHVVSGQALIGCATLCSIALIRVLVVVVIVTPGAVIPGFNPDIVEQNPPQVYFGLLQALDR